MKQYDILLSFGCSHTFGGGLNAPEYHKFLNSGLAKDQLNEYATMHSFPKYLADRLNCKFINFGRGAASNEYIFQTAYNNCRAHAGQKILVTLQTSILSRLFLTSASGENEYLINTPVGQPKYAADFYTQYLDLFFNENTEYSKLLRNIDLFQAWFSANDIDFVFLAWEALAELPEKYFFKFPINNGSFNEYAIINQLLIKDIPGIPFKDHHLTEQGNEQVADLLFEHIKRKYD